MPGIIDRAVHDAGSGTSSLRNYSLFILPIWSSTWCHGTMMLVFILVGLCATMAAAGYLIEPGAGWFPRACRSR
jgi:hypothetical protein